MKNLLIFGLCSVLATLSGCSETDGYIEIKDASKPFQQVIQSDQKNPHKIRYIITGNTDGSFNFGGLIYEGGKINDTITGDHYVDTALISYKPIEAKSGQLKITYKFIH